MRLRIKCFAILVSIVSLLSSVVVHSQTLNPSYLSEMPAPARVIAEIKGKDAGDAGARQLGAFSILVTLISDMAYGLEHRFERQLTPDEQRITNAYTKAYTDHWQKVKDTYGRQYQGEYNHDRDLRNEVLDKFFSANFKALYTKSNQQSAKQLQAARDRANGNTPANNGSNAPSTPTGGPGSTEEMNRCVASGRTMRRCFTEVMSTGFSTMFGGGIEIKVPDGLRMTGDYASANGLRLIFEPEAVTMVCHGVSSPHAYSVELTNTQALINIDNETKPLIVSLTQDGKLSGTGPVKVTGKVPSGSHTVQTSGMSTQTTTHSRELTPLEAGQYPNATQNGQTFSIQQDSTELVFGPTGTRREVDYVTKTEQCNVGVLSPIGGSPLPVANEISTNPFAYITTLFSGAMTLMQGGNSKEALDEMLNPKAERAIAPGLRMHGRYAGQSGFSLVFHPESVTLGCGEAERALDYSVQRSGTNTMLVVKENGNATTFQLMPDGSVVGQGMVQVNGRVITGTTEDIKNPFTFAPRVARCEAGRLATGGAATNAPGATNTSSPVPTNPTPQVNSSVTSTPSPGSRGGISLTITAGPSVASLLANKTLVVLKDSLENALAHSGVSPAGRSSRISAWSEACGTAPKDQICQSGITAFRSYAVATAKLDANGSASFANIPATGTFYVVADTPRSHHLFWNVRVDLKPGSNSIRLDESNTTPVDR